MNLNWVRPGLNFADVKAAIDALVPAGPCDVLCTGVEAEDRLLLALLDLRPARIVAVPANEGARAWLLDLNAPAVTIRNSDDAGWHADRFDVVACASSLQDAGPALLEADWVADFLLKPRGRLFVHGALPGHLQAERRETLPPALADNQARLFHVSNGGMRARRGAFRRLDFLGWCPRKLGTTSHVAWLAFSRRRGQTQDPPPCEALTLARGLEPVLEDLSAFHPPRHLAGRRFDRIIFVNNSLTDDPRVMRALRCADSPEGRALGARRGDVNAASGQQAPAMAGLPDHRERVGRRLRLAGIARSRGPWRELALAATGRDLERLIRDHGAPDLVLHTHDMDGVVAGAVAAPAAKASGGAWVHDVHEYAAGYDGVIDVQQDLSRAALAWERAHLRKADAVITVSPLLGRKISALYGLPDPPHIVLNAIDDGQAQPYAPSLRQTHDVPPAALLLLHVGSLRPGRGIETAIGALKRLPGAHLVCVGDGATEFLEGLTALATTEGVAARFHLHGYVDSRYLISLSGQADIGLVPTDSYGNAEVSLPNKLFIYVAAGLPVVSTATAEMARVVSDRGIGRLCPPGDPVAMADAIADAAQSRPALRAALADSGLSDEMSWRAQCRTLTRIYESVLTARPGVAANPTTPES